MISFQKILEWKGYPIADAGRQIAYFRSLGPQEKKAWIQSRKNEILDFHLKHHPLYRKLLSGQPVPGWNDLPVIRKKDLQMPIAEMLTAPFGVKDVYIANTSGSSGHPFFFAKDKFSHALTWAYIFDQYRQLGIKSDHWQARFYGIPLDFISYTKEKIKDRFMHRVRFPVFDMGDEMLEKFLQKFRTTRIHYLYGYTNSILLFSRFLLQKKIVLRKICPTLFCCIVTSEVCTEEDKQLISEATGVPVYREYGASELDVIAMEDQEGRWAINESNLFVEVLSDDNRVLSPGEEGRLVITSLFNKAMPFIRYEIGDIGMLEEDGGGLKLKQLSGRVNDTIILPSGKKSPGLTFYYVSRSILESSGVLKEFIIRQTAIDSFEFDIVSDRPLKEDEIRDINLKMIQYLEPGLKLTINRVEKIRRPASGKIKHFYSEIIK